MLRKTLFLLMATVLLISLAGAGLPSAKAADGLTLFTPYTGISVTPGESINYTVEVINDTGSVQNMTFNISDLPEGWTSTLRSGGRDVQQLAVKSGGEAQEVDLDIQVPLKVEKGDYTFTLQADGSGVEASLPLTVTVSEEGTYDTEITIDQPNLEGDASASFDYNMTLNNRTAEDQQYALTAKAPKGWDVQFQADSNNVTSVTLEPNTTKDVTISVTPPENVKAETYTIPIAASAGSTSAEAELEAVITGSYKLNLSTPSGRLNADVTAGGDQTMELLVTNQGSAPIREIELSAQSPSNWDVTFDQERINVLEAGESTSVKATVQSSDDAIAGDYVVSMSAESPEASSNADIRVSVKTSMLWGFIAILIILAVIGGVYYLIRTYGRR